MKLLVVSDTHEMVKDLNKLLMRYSQEVELVIHLGDYPSDLMQLQSQYPHLKMVALDGTGYEIDFPMERVLKLNGVSILIVHGHRHGVKTNMQQLVYYAQEKQVNACFFGHTHMSTIFEDEKSGIFFMNPGSLSFPRDGRQGRYGIVEISHDGAITGEIITL